MVDKDTPTNEPYPHVHTLPRTCALPICTARRLIGEQAEEIRSADADAYDAVVQQIAELEKVWPAVQPPDAPLSSAGEVSAKVSEIELTLSRDRTSTRLNSSH